MKKFLIISGIALSTTMVTLVVLLAWQPDVLKTAVLNLILHHASSDQPYRVAVDRVEGNFFHTLSLKHVKLITRSTELSLVEAEDLDLEINWRALMRHEADIHFRMQQQRGTLQGHTLLELTPLRNLTADFKSEGLLLHLPSGGALLTGESQMSGPLSDLKQFSAQADVRLDPPKGGIQRIGHSTARIRLLKGKGTLESNIELAAARANVQARLDLANQKWQGTWRAETKDLQKFAAFSTAFKPATGPLEASGQFAIHGQAGWATAHFVSREIKWAGQPFKDIDVHVKASQTSSGKLNATLSAPSLNLNDLGLDLRDIRIAIEQSSNTLRIRDGMAHTSKGDIHITGSIIGSSLDITVLTHEFQIEKQKRQRALGNLNLHFVGTLPSPKLRGDIVITEALYDVAKDKKKKEKESKNKKEPEGKPARALKPAPDSFWTRLDVDVGARWDRDVWYRDGITGIETQGDIRVQKAPGATDLVLTGQISCLQGTYYYYGKDFVIESGLLQFTGPPEINPLITVEASYRSDPTIVYLDVTGTLKKPVLKLRSNPPLPEQDVLSVLVFGRPLHELNTSVGGNSQQEVATMAGNILGSYATQGLRATGIELFDLDLLNLAPTEQGNRLTLGRYLTRNVFVSYGHTLSPQSHQGLVADYYFDKHWTLEAGAGATAEENHMDFLFRYPLNSKQAHGGAMPRGSPFRNSLDKSDPQTYTNGH